jgi:CheY-like chemotaxis protein
MTTTRMIGRDGAKSSLKCSLSARHEHLYRSTVVFPYVQWNCRPLTCYALVSGGFAIRPKMSTNAKFSEQLLVCVVDDDSLTRDSMLRLLRSYGFRAEAFSSGEEFIDSGYLERTACLILDVRLPGMSGIELHQRLLASHCEVPVIFITAYEYQQMRARALRECIGPFLLKPLSEGELLTAINDAIAPG